MPSKHKPDASAGNKLKKRKTVMIENKVEIIKQSEKGEMPFVIKKVIFF